MDLISKEKPPKIEEYGNNSDNLLFFGENYVVLDSMVELYKERVQCIYMDPPYNTCNSFMCFQDNLEQDVWEKNLIERLEKLWLLLCDSGSLWISIDDSEFADLKVLCDKLWGREHFILCIVRQKNKYPSSTERTIVHMHDYILVYAKNREKVKLHEVNLYTLDANNIHEENLENLLIWTSSLGKPQDEKDYLYPITSPRGEELFPPAKRCWRLTKSEYYDYLREGRIFFDKQSVFPYIITSTFFKSQMHRPTSLWLENLVGSNQEARYEIKKYDTGQFFYVPKPERLLFNILSICTDKGDLVLDPYLGSGTTCAVAHKMKRQWIGIEQGYEQFYNICLPRLKNVVDGNDSTIVTDLLGWKGGGGFKVISLCDESDT